MTEEQTIILQMVENGRITAEEAHRLLAALNRPGPTAAVAEPALRGRELPRPAVRPVIARSPRGTEQRGRRVNMAGAELCGSNLSGAELTEADLTGAKLSEADLSNAKLAGASLADADLSNANLSRADLSGADLTKANLNEADLSAAMLTGANLTQADPHHA